MCRGAKSDLIRNERIIVCIYPGYIRPASKSTVCGGVVAQWLEHTTDNRVVAGSNHTGAA